MTNSTNNAADTTKHNQFQLMSTRRFAPFFWTQFCGAFNDNVYKNALILLIAFQTTLTISTDILINMAAGLFILPFFLFSAMAGQIADKFEKAALMRIIKALEIVIMVLAAAALYFQHTIVLMLLLFLMGTQSSFFGPIKYSIIPQLLEEREIIGGNAMVEMGTFVSILLGTVTAGVLVQLSHGRIFTALMVVCIAVIGWLCSRYIPPAPAADPNLSLNWNPFVQIWKTIGYARQEHSVLLSIIGISWFWFLGASYLTQIPNYTKNVLHGSESIVTLLLTMFSIGIGVGSLLCEWLSGRKVEYGLVPIGAMGLSIFGFDLVWAYQVPPTETLQGLGEFLASPGSFRVMIDLVMIGVFGGFYIVPLYALVQLRSQAVYRSQVIAANNIINALFMTIAAIFAAVLIGVFNLFIPYFFLVLVLMNAAVAVFICSLVPEFTMRCVIWVLTHIGYRIRHVNLERIPLQGPAIIVSNHVSYVDALIIAGLCRHPVRFVIAADIFNIPILNFIFRTAKAIPITPKSQDEAAYNQAFEQISAALDNGDIICIFPEGKLTRDGQIDTFRTGIEKILTTNPVPVIPTALCGLWGSFFSYKGGPAMKHFPRRFFSRIEYRVGEPIMPENVTGEYLRQQVVELRGDRV